MSRFFRLLSVLAVIVVVFYGGFSIIDDMYLPERVYIEEGGEFSYAQGLLTVVPKQGELSEAAARPGDSYNAQLCLFGMIPVKTVRVSTVGETYLIPGGMTFGVKMFTSGVVVVGMSDVYTVGGAVCPAKDAGLMLGDIIESIDGVKVSGNDDLSSIVSASGGQALRVTFLRENVRQTVRMTPANARDGTGYRAGMWVRDSSAGIGTVTYINPTSGMMAGLGHGVTDTDTGTVLPVASGELVPVRLSGVVKGQVGSPGELRGNFGARAPYAVLDYNCEAGVFGTVLYDFYNSDPLQVAYRQDIKIGAAKILCTVDENGPRYFDIEIETINLSDATPTKNMVIRITDSELLKITGGIVQGMSGSPIVQNGKIIGAVTHVFVNDPTKGYGIFIENMLYNEQHAVNLKNNLAA